MQRTLSSILNGTFGSFANCIPRSQLTDKKHQDLNRSMDPQGNALKDCIRLRGLPYVKTPKKSILEFLEEYTYNIVEKGVHITSNTRGQPGEALVQMDSEISAAIAANKMHNRYISCGKKQHQIEVSQCSRNDMSMELTESPLSESPDEKKEAPKIKEEAKIIDGVEPLITFKKEVIDENVKIEDESGVKNNDSILKDILHDIYVQEYIEERKRLFPTKQKIQQNKKRSLEIEENKERFEEENSIFGKIKRERAVSPATEDGDGQTSTVGLPADSESGSGQKEGS